MWLRICLEYKNESFLSSLAIFQYLFQPGEFEGGRRRATDSIWSLNLHNIKNVTRQRNGPPREFVCEFLFHHIKLFALSGARSDFHKQFSNNSSNQASSAAVQTTFAKPCAFTACSRAITCLRVITGMR